MKGKENLLNASSVSTHRDLRLPSLKFIINASSRFVSTTFEIQELEYLRRRSLASFLMNLLIHHHFQPLLHCYALSTLCWVYLYYKTANSTFETTSKWINTEANESLGFNTCNGVSKESKIKHIRCSLTKHTYL